MIIDELQEIFKNPNDKNIGLKLNNLYDEFRNGRDPEDLLFLLNSDDKMISYGCDICCEIKVKSIAVKNEMLKKLSQILSENKDSYNRERAFDALYGFYMEDNNVEGFKNICEEYKDDPIYGISFFATNYLNDANFKMP